MGPPYPVSPATWALTLTQSLSHCLLSPCGLLLRTCPIRTELPDVGSWEFLYLQFTESAREHLLNESMNESRNKLLSPAVGTLGWTSGSIVGRGSARRPLTALRAAFLSDVPLGCSHWFWNRPQNGLPGLAMCPTTAVAVSAVRGPMLSWGFQQTQSGRGMLKSHGLHHLPPSSQSSCPVPHLTRAI